MAGQTAILDMLFDTSEGILMKEDIPEIQTLDFSNLGLIPGEFDDLFGGHLLGDLGKPTSPQTPATFTDHDYVMQPARSPASSDSGVSVDSGANSPRNSENDLSTVCTDASNVSGSPQSDYQYSPHIVPNNELGPGDPLSCSPDMTDQSGINYLDLENFDFSDISDINLDTIDPSAIITDDQFEHNVIDEDVAIDLGNHSDLMSFDTSTNIAINSDGSETKTIKIIKVSANLDTLPFTMKDVCSGTKMGGHFPELRLTNEEKDLLSKEGLSIPTDMPLTKEEERALKGVRRKIRNKVSAKESRKRKMDYVDGLEKRVKRCTQENQTLNKKVENLEKHNVTLMNQLKKLQTIISIKSTRTAQASTCVMLDCETSFHNFVLIALATSFLMESIAMREREEAMWNLSVLGITLTATAEQVLLLSFAFLIVPNFNPFRDHDSMEEIQSVPLPGMSRNLLHKSGDDVLPTDDNPYGITVRPAPFWEQPPITPVLPEFGKEIKELDIDDSRDQKTIANDKVVYVQIEQSVDGSDQISNVTYVPTEAEYKQDFTTEAGGGAVENNLEEGANQKHDL